MTKQDIMSEISYSFGKEYKLCSKKLIDQLFSEGKQVKKFPLIVRFLEVENENTTSIQIGITVPKKLHKSAVSRNRIKRLCREAIRLNKNDLERFLSTNNRKIALFLIYTSKEEIPLIKIQDLITNLFKQIKNEIDH